MISSRKLIRMARKWQRKAAIRRKRISLPGKSASVSTSTGTSSSSSTPMAEKGCIVVYTCDQKRYSLPIAYLNNYIFRELLEMAEEEFGLPSDRPITIPCEAIFMDYLISLVQGHATVDVGKAFLLSIFGHRCSYYSCKLDQSEIEQDSLVPCF